LSSQPETVTETPGFPVKIRAMPLKPLYRTITQYQEVSFTLSWHPAVAWWYIWILTLHSSTTPCVLGQIIIEL